ncbi:MAG: right-handed parallel beta-helix repeat-containing protein, partial [Thermoplasmata archaeon]|nr:right-handed parallel beta-helix repeat-containing protein [Thermoplasmata archaeon]
MGLLLLMGILIITIYPYTANPLPYGNVLFVDDDFTPDPSNNKFNDIQAAINAANDGDIIYIFEGTYEGNIWVDKELRIIGEAAGKVVIDGNGRNYAVNIVQNNVTVENLTINNGLLAGIGTGIFSDNVNVTIKNCIIHGNEEYGLEILSDNVTVINCTIYDLPVAMKISATNVTITHSTVYETEWGIVIEGAENCIIQDTEIHDIENKSIKVQDSENVIIKNVTAFASFCGLWLKNARNSTVINSNFSGNRIGIRIEESENNTIESNLIADNVGYGIYAIDSFNNTIHHNNFINNGINAYDTGHNIWNSSIGNYWDDYKGYDGNGDGIGELPYYIGDYRPLVYPIERMPLFVWVDDDYTTNTPGWGLDHFSNLQQAVDSLRENGSCYVYSGIYQGCNLYKSITLIGEKNAIIRDVGDGLFVTADNVRVKGFYIE